MYTASPPFFSNYYTRIHKSLLATKKKNLKFYSLSLPINFSSTFVCNSVEGQNQVFFFSICSHINQSAYFHYFCNSHTFNLLILYSDTSLVFFIFWVFILTHELFFLSFLLYFLGFLLIEVLQEEIFASSLHITNNIHICKYWHCILMID